MKVLFAGAGSLFGINEIKNSLQQVNIESCFVENSFMSKKLENEDKREVKITEDILFDDYDLVLPTNEYWLSKCIKQNVSNISDQAKKASRDKIYFNTCLSNYGIITSSLCDYDYVCKNSGTYIVKPRYAYSGKGVSVCNNQNYESLLKSIDFAKTGISNTSEITNLKENEVTFWKYEEGIEYSADVFYYKGDIHFIRLCEKVIKIINNRPCTLGYKLINEVSSISTAIKSWCRALFEEDNISFIQFDFIKRARDGIYIPIDFASRIAGGVHTLLKELDYNPYLNAMLLNDYKISTMNTQINLISCKSGKVKSDDYSLETFKCNKNKKVGDVVTEDITSGSNRLAEFICTSYSRDDFEKKAELGLQGSKYVF